MKTENEPQRWRHKWKEEALLELKRTESSEEKFRAYRNNSFEYVHRLEEYRFLNKSLNTTKQDSHLKENPIRVHRGVNRPRLTTWPDFVMEDDDNNNRPPEMPQKWTWCGYEVPGIVLLPELKGDMRLDRSNDISVYVSTCTAYDLNTSTPFVWKLWRW
jgi:hypothetical protein